MIDRNEVFKIAHEAIAQYRLALKTSKDEDMCQVEAVLEVSDKYIPKEDADA